MLEPMLTCQQPNIVSGATAIGSAARAPDEDREELVIRVLAHGSLSIKEANS